MIQSYFGTMLFTCVTVLVIYLPLRLLWLRLRRAKISWGRELWLALLPVRCVQRPLGPGRCRRLVIRRLNSYQLFAGNSLVTVINRTKSGLLPILLPRYQYSFKRVERYFKKEFYPLVTVLVTVLATVPVAGAFICRPYPRRQAPKNRRLPPLSRTCLEAIRAPAVRAEKRGTDRPPSPKVK